MKTNTLKAILSKPVFVGANDDLNQLKKILFVLQNQWLFMIYQFCATCLL